MADTANFILLPPKNQGQETLDRPMLYRCLEAGCKEQIDVDHLFEHAQDKHMLSSFVVDTRALFKPEVVRRELQSIDEGNG